MNTIDIATHLSGGRGRDPVWTALRVVGGFMWTMLALHGLLNLFKPTPLRETIIPIVLGALVWSALTVVLTKRHQREVE